MNTDKKHPWMDKLLFSEEQIQKRVKELGQQISVDFAGRNPIIISVLKGSILFYSDLVKHITIPCTFDFVSASSYGNGFTSSGEIDINFTTNTSIIDKEILLIEDIVDTGNTLAYLQKVLKEKGAAKVEVCTLLLTTEVYKQEFKLDYVAMEIPARFIVGFGLDYDQLGRNSKDIYVLKD